MEEVGEEIKIRRYFGTGMNRNKFEVKTLGRLVDYASTELIGTILQGDQKLIVLVDDLETFQFPLPIVKNDKVVVKRNGVEKEINIEGPNGNTRRIAGELIAYELQVRG
jgi:hypothetical protein